MKNYKILLLLCTAIITQSCFEDQDDNARDTTVQDFVWRGLNFWSLYKADVPDLANDRFGSFEERTIFLNKFDTPEDAFEALTSERDRFSIIRDDYIILENALAGVRRSTGMRFSLKRNPQNQSLVYGVVRYVIAGSPAALAGVQRGDIFTAVNGITLDQNSDFDLIFSAENFTIDLATYDGTTFTLTGESINLDNVELTINPVHLAKTIDIDGEKVGYLHYTGFTNEFDPELNNAFAQFKSAGVSDLILDLRYNGGGSIETANDLCTMITGQFESQEFITQQYNVDRNPEYEFVRRFNQNIGNDNDGERINSLGLTRVFVLTSNSTASASELILSGLDPYIEVIQVGESTRGKFEGSFLLYDAPAPGFRRSEANSAHRYVMLPLVLKSINANGFTDYFDGISPEEDLMYEEDFFNLGTLGDPSDPLLAMAINKIKNGRASRPEPNPAHQSEKLFDIEETEPLFGKMYVEPQE